MSFSLSSFVLILSKFLTRRWSLPVLKMLITVTFVKMCDLSAMMKSISFFGAILGEIQVQRLFGRFLKNVFVIFSWCLSLKLTRASPLLFLDQRS